MSVIILGRTMTDMQTSVVGSRGADDIYKNYIVPPHRDPVILREQVLLQLRQITDPDLYQDIVSLGFVKDLRIEYESGNVSFTLELTTPACPVKEVFVTTAEKLLKLLGWVTNVDIKLTSKKAQGVANVDSENLINVTSIICVASCKGGVGKSSIAVNLAYMLNQQGASVGLVDADVYGPSLPQLIPLENHQISFYSKEEKQLSTRRKTKLSYERENDDHSKEEEEKDKESEDKDDDNDDDNSNNNTKVKSQSNKKVDNENYVEKNKVVATGKGWLIPLKYGGVKLMSSGYLKSTLEYAAIRGPIASNLALQMVSGTYWGSLDYLIVDLPPGTGDIHLSLAQNVRVDGAIMVTTPQQLSLVDVERGIHMFNNMQIPTIAVVENMSFLECPYCKNCIEVFNHETAVNATKIFSNNIKDFDTKLSTNNNNNNNNNNNRQVEDNDTMNTQLSYNNPYSNIRRLLEQFGVKAHFKLPLHNDMARLRFFDNATHMYVSPLTKAYLPTSHEIVKRFKNIADFIVREISTIKFSGDRAPDVTAFGDGMIQVVVRDRESNVDKIASETVLHVPCRVVRLSCRCAECVDEFTGVTKLQSRKIPYDVHPLKMSQKGMYAISIEWSDGHSSLMAFTTLQTICHNYERRSIALSGKTNCEGLSLDW